MLVECPDCGIPFHADDEGLMICPECGGVFYAYEDDDRRAIRASLAFSQMGQGIEKFIEAIAVGMLPAIRACALAFGEFSRQVAKMNQGTEGR